MAGTVRHLKPRLLGACLGAAILCTLLFGAARIDPASAATATSSAGNVKLQVYSRSRPRSIKALRRNGIALRVGCSQTCTVHAKILIPARQAAALGLRKRRIGRAVEPVTGTEHAFFRVRVIPKIGKKLAGSLNYTLLLHATPAAVL